MVQQKLPVASTEEQSQERVYSSGSTVTVDQIQENDPPLFNVPIQYDDVLDSLKKVEERLRVVEEREKRISLIEDSISRRLRELEKKETESNKKETESDLRLVTVEKQSEEALTQLKNKKLSELEMAQKDFDLKQRKEIKEIEAREKELRSLEEALKEKTAELKMKEDNFELKREENELKSKDLEIKEKALEKRLKELELKQTELDGSIQQFTEAETKKRSNLELGPLLLVEKDSDDVFLTHLAKKNKSHDANDGDIEGLVCTYKSDENVPNEFSKSMSSFAVDQVWALFDPRDGMPRSYAQIRRILDSQMSLQVTLLEHVKTDKDEKSIFSGCGTFEYGDTEIKSYLKFAHEMDYITCDNNVIVKPRKCETWALFRDWDISWNTQPDLHKPPHRYDFVEVIMDFDDLTGIEVAYMGKVEGFASVFKYGVQHGFIKRMIPPHEMRSFSHKVESVKLSGDEEKGIPAGSFLLNPAATPSYDPVLEEAGERGVYAITFMCS